MSQQTDDVEYCRLLAASEATEETKRVPHRVKSGLATDAMLYVKSCGSDVDKETAKQEFIRRHVSHSARAAEGTTTQVYGFGILTQIVISLCIFFFERWWARTHPNV